MQKRRKILYIITKSVWGGAQRYVYDLATALPQDQFDVAVVAGGNGPLIERLHADGIRVIPIESLKRDVSARDEFRSFRELGRIFRTERPDIVHLNSSKAGGLGALAARLAGVPRIIFTAHGWAFNESRSRLQRFLIRVLHTTTILLTHNTICVSQAIYDDVRGLSIVRRKLEVIHLGITPPRYYSREEARRVLASDDARKRWVGMIAELHPTKRIEDALIAMGMLKDRYPDLLLLIAGEGSHRQKLEKMALQKGLGGRVQFLGFIPDAATYLKAFDVFLFPSRTEALGYALLEAGAAAAPVVASRVGGIPEVVADNVSGRLVTPERPSELADAMAELLEHPVQAEKYGTALKEHVTNDFSFARMLAETTVLYND